MDTSIEKPEYGFKDEPSAKAWATGRGPAPDDASGEQPAGGKDPQAGQQSVAQGTAAAAAALGVGDTSPEDGEEEQEKIRRILARTGLSDSAARQVMKAENKRVRTMAFIKEGAAEEEIERIKSEITSAQQFLRDQSKVLGKWNSLGETNEDRYAAIVQHLRNTEPDTNLDGMNLDELLQKATAKSAAGQLSSLASEALTVVGSKIALDIMLRPPYSDKDSDGQYKRDLTDEDLVKIADEVCKNVNEEYKKETGDDGQLDEPWLNASCGQVLQTLRNIDELGMDVREIEDFYWDTQTGNQLAGTLDHGTSSDFMVVMKDGTTIGNSLKKDGRIYFANLGTQSFVDSAVASLPEGDKAREILMPGGVNIAQKVIDDANEDIIDHFKNNEITRDQMQTALDDLCKQGDAAVKKVFGTSGKPQDYCGEKMDGVMARMFDDDGNFRPESFSGNRGELTVKQRSYLCRFTAGGADIFNGIESTCRDQDSKVTAAMVEASAESDVFRRQLQGSVVKGLHIMEHIGLGDPPPDFLVTSFGRGRLNRENILGDVFKLDDQKINELNAQIAEANDPETSPERRKEIQEQVESFFTDKIDLTYEDGSFRAELVFDDGSPIPVAELSNRAKGSGLKTNTLIAPSKELKNVLGPNVGKTLKLEQQEESLSPREQQLRNELKKLVRDIAINRLGDYGN
jgi:hypothetical protein